MALQNWGERDETTLGAELRWHLHGELPPAPPISATERLLCAGAALCHLASLGALLYGAVRFLTRF